MTDQDMQIQKLWLVWQHKTNIMGRKKPSVMSNKGGVYMVQYVLLFERWDVVA